MEDRINKLITELTQADPSLKGRESALRALLQEMLSNRPDVVMDPAFRERLGRQLRAQGALARPRSAGWRGMRLYYGLGTAALLVILIIAARPADQPTQVAFKSGSESELDAAAPAAAPEAGDTITMTAARQANTTMQLTSTAFSEGQPIPAQYTCDGGSAMPPLAWTGIPGDAQSLAVVLHDPDASRPGEGSPGGTSGGIASGGFTHWVVYDIPAHSPSAQGTDGANGTGKTGYVGPCPPSGTHHYVFTLYALDTLFGLKEGTDQAGFLEAASGHILATVELVGTYQRK